MACSKSVSNDSQIPPTPYFKVLVENWAPILSTIKFGGKLDKKWRFDFDGGCVLTVSLSDLPVTTYFKIFYEAGKWIGYFPLQRKDIPILGPVATLLKQDEGNRERYFAFLQLPEEDFRLAFNHLAKILNEFLGSAFDRKQEYVKPHEEAGDTPEVFPLTM